MGVCHLVGAGDFFGPLRLSEDDLIVAVDGGLDSLLKNGYCPDVLIGDMDSAVINTPLPGVEIFRYKVEKDETDMLLAYEYGKSRGYKEFFIYGGTGGREDHTFANYCLLLDAINEKKRIYLMGNGRKIFVIKNEKITLESTAGKTLSVFAFGADAHGVCLRGVNYEAEGITLSHAFPLGVSNSIKEDGTRAQISVDNGALLVMLET